MQDFLCFMNIIAKVVIIIAISLAIVWCFIMSDVGVIKVSFHTETAGDTASHNDRSMYKYGYEHRDENVHGDYYNLGSSVLTEIRFYEEHFGGILLKQNERYIKNRHVNRVMSMDEYRAAHPPKETIIQLGKRELNFGDGYLFEAIEVYKKCLEDAGCYVISWDIHNDEKDGTPHLHVRWIGIDSKGRPNVTGCLREHGVEKADVRYTQEEADSYNKTHKKNPVKAGDPKGRKYCNELTQFTNDCRDVLESLADDYLSRLESDGLSVSREREAGAHHYSVAEFKSRKRREERERRLDERESEVASREAGVVESERSVALQREQVARQMEAIEQRQEDLDLREFVVDGRESSVRVRESRLDDAIRFFRDAAETFRSGMMRSVVRAVVSVASRAMPHIARDLRSWLNSGHAFGDVERELAVDRDSVEDRVETAKSELLPELVPDDWKAFGDALDNLPRDGWEREL